MQFRQAETCTQLCIEPVGQRFGGRLKALQSLFDQCPQARLVQAFGSGVDRRQVVRHRWDVGAEKTVFWMVELKAGSPGTGFAKAAHPCTGAKLLLLDRGKMKEAQADDARTVAQAYQQAAATPLDHITGRNFTFHHGFMAGTQRADGSNAGTVLIT